MSAQELMDFKVDDVTGSSAAPVTQTNIPLVNAAINWMVTHTGWPQILAWVKECHGGEKSGSVNMADELTKAIVATLGHTAQ